MATSRDDTQYFASMYESITGHTTITDPQQIDGSVRFENLAEEQTVSNYLHSIVKADGLEDVIEDPERSR